jgi:hypothetical protein
MLFSFYLGNHTADRLKKLRDVVAPIHHGLVEAGHRVIDFGLSLALEPAMNVLVENFADDATTDRILKLKAEQGDRLRFGIVCPADVEDDEAMESAAFPRRLGNLRRLLPAADFVWTLLPQAALYAAWAGPGKAAQVELGFTERLLNRQPISNAGLRDLDILVIGRETPHRDAAVAELRRRGLACFTTGAKPLPSFALDDLVRRTNILLDLRRHAGARYASMVRIAKGLHSGTLVLSERNSGRFCRLDDYILPVDPKEVVERCIVVIQSGMAVDMGLAALAKFRAETSMRRNMEALLKLPFFERVAAQKS